MTTLSDLTLFLEGRNGGHPVPDPCGYAMDLIVSLEAGKAAEANEVAALKGARTRGAASMSEHRDICSFRGVPPEECPVCKTRPPYMPFRDTPMPPYKFQPLDFGSGSASQRLGTVYSVG